MRHAETGSEWPLGLALCGMAAFLAAAAIGPFFSHPGYSWLSNSVSELAGQDMPNAWIMRTGFFAFGCAMFVASMARARQSRSVFVPLAVFGFSMVATAIWSHVPIPEIGGGSKTEDDLHSVAASMMGMAFAAACCARGWQRRRSKADWLSIAGVAVSIIVPLLMLAIPSFAGALQRLMFLFSFGWIIDSLRMAPPPDASHRRPPRGPSEA